MYLTKDPNSYPSLGARVRRDKPKTEWYLGLDLGQRRDASALACLEISWKNTGTCPLLFAPRFVPSLALLSLDRFPLGTDYEEIPRMVGRRAYQIDALPRPWVDGVPPKHVIVDGGGPGPPVIDRLRRKLVDLVNVRPVLITSGKGQSTLTNGYTGVPRRTLISDVLLLMSNDTLQFPPDLEHGERLEEEFANLSGGTTHPATVAANDDLVMAVALAVWGALLDSPELLPDRPIKREDCDTGEVWTPQQQRRIPEPERKPNQRRSAK